MVIRLQLPLDSAASSRGEVVQLQRLDRATCIGVVAEVQIIMLHTAQEN